jgi:predicted metal-dependent phosphoesterase TrpH
MVYSKKIKFLKPNISGLNEKSYMCCDMHCHTIFSDGSARIKDILIKIKKLKIGIAITDHNEIKGVLKAKSYKNSENIIPGVEVKVRNNIDLLFYFYNTSELKKFYNKEIKNYKKGFLISKIPKSPDEILDISRNYNCIVSLAHLGKYDLRNIKKIINKVNTIEVLNSGISRKKNLLALKLVKEYKKGFTGGSDAHSIYEIGNALTYSKAKNIKEFLDNIKKKNNFVVGNELKFGLSQRLFLNMINRFSNILK